MDDEEFFSSESEKFFLNACAKGLLHQVKRYVENGTNCSFNKSMPLYKAVRNGATAVVQYLLEHGADPNERNVVAISCQRSYTTILKHLLNYGGSPHYGTDKLGNKRLGRPILESILHGNTACVLTLLEHQADVHIDDDCPLLLACEKNLPNIVRILLDYGAYVDIKNGKPLTDACMTGNQDLVSLLIEYGADVDVNNSQPLELAIRHNRLPVVKILLHAGANAWFIYQLLDGANINYRYPSTTTRTLLETCLKETQYKRLRQAIRTSLKKEDFKWQEMCRPVSASSSKKWNPRSALVEQAKLFNIAVDENDTKRTICAKFALNMEQQERILYDEHFTDFSGNDINNLRPWQIMSIDNIPFNCFDLFKMLQQGIRHNPYTKTKLPIEKIRSRENFLRKTLTKERFSNKDLLDDVRNTPIFNESEILENRLSTEIWEKLYYPPRMSIVMNASDTEIDNMVVVLRYMCFPRLWSSHDQNIHWSAVSDNNNIYPMLTRNTVEKIRSSMGLLKKREFINLLSHIVNFRDEHKDTRIMLLSVLFNQFADNDADEFLPHYRSWRVRHMGDTNDNEDEGNGGVYDFFTNEEPNGENGEFNGDQTQL